MWTFFLGGGSTLLPINHVFHVKRVTSFIYHPLQWLSVRLKSHTCHRIENQKCKKDMIHIKLTLHEFIGENMQAGISNMEDIHELMLWSDIFVFRVHKTTVLIQKASFFKCAQRLEVHAFWQKLRKNLTKSYLHFIWGISQAATEFRFWIGAQNFADRLILSAKMKKSQKISIKK